MKILEKTEIKGLTTMRLGGEARFVVEITKAEEIPQVLNWIEEGGELTDSDGKTVRIDKENVGLENEEQAGRKTLPWFVLGGGANTIGRDEGFPGVIFRMKIFGMEVLDETADGVLVRGGAGEVWDDFVKFTVERGYSGIECLAKIPGSVGAAPVQNIGAYGQEIVQVIDHVEAYDPVAKEFVVLGRDEMAMSYRSTLFNTGPDRGRYIITAVTVMLENDEKLKPPFYASLQKYLDVNLTTEERAEFERDGYPPEVLYDAVSKIRGEKLPDPREHASAGSFFKNIYFESTDAEGIAHAKEIGLVVYDMPDGRKSINSGALVEMAGLKGRLVHGMRVSDKAALILINEAATGYADLAAAREEIRAEVSKQFGFELEQEPVEIAV